MYPSENVLQVRVSKRIFGRELTHANPFCQHRNYENIYIDHSHLSSKWTEDRHLWVKEYRIALNSVAQSLTSCPTKATFCSSFPSSFASSGYWLSTFQISHFHYCMNTIHESITEISLKKTLQ